MCFNSYLHLKNTCYQVQTLSSHHMTGHLTKGGGVEERIRLYSESQKTEKMIDKCLKITIFLGRLDAGVLYRTEKYCLGICNVMVKLGILGIF